MKTKTPKMKNILTRSISGSIYVALIVGSLLAGPDWFMALAMVLAIAAMTEFQSLTSPSANETAIGKAIHSVDIIAVAAMCLLTRNEFYALVFLIWLIAVYLTIRIVLALYDRRSDAFAATGRSVMSVIYIGLPLAIASFINHLHPSGHLILTMFIMIWLNDTGAFCVGSLIGRHRLFERLSPKKSWEGFFGGLAFCMAAGAVCFQLFGEGYGSGIWAWIGMGAVVSVFATWGDLFESLMKRTLGVKDSGRMIPGHGGMLDRIDSLLLVAPAFAAYLLLTGMI